jgi:hypothetical protein
VTLWLTLQLTTVKLTTGRGQERVTELTALPTRGLPLRVMALIVSRKAGNLNPICDSPVGVGVGSSGGGYKERV